MKLREKIQTVVFHLSPPAIAVAVGAVWMALLAVLTNAALMTADTRFPSFGAIFAIILVNVLYLSLLTLVWRVLFLLMHCSEHRRRSAILCAMVLGGLAAFPFFLAGTALAQGDWISRQSYAPLIGPGVSLFGFIAFTVVGFITWALHFNHFKRSLLIKSIIGGFALLTLVLSIVDAVVLPKQYPVFHHLLFATTAALTSILATEIVTRGAPKLPSRVLKIAGVTALSFITFSLYVATTLRPVIKAELLSISATTADVINRIVPSPPRTNLLMVLNSFDFAANDSIDHPPSRIKVGKDWNVILVVLDTLRADAVPPGRTRNRSFAKAQDTPFLNRWLKDTYRFNHNFAPANVTQYSIPAIFHSTEAYEKHPKSPSIAAIMSNLGRLPIAVVNDWFLWSPTQRSRKLLDDFELVDMYPESRMHDQVGKMLDAVDRVKEEPFFAWFHFYSLHFPLFAGTRRLKDTPGPYTKKYRSALRWTDSEVEKLITGLESRGLMNRTILVLTADHGESLKERGYLTHGYTVHDEEVRVPLAIRIPGHTGCIIDATTGSIDILPTLVDLLGGEKDHRAHGHSLAPLMSNHKAAWDRRYYLKSRHNDVHGLVAGYQKLTYQADHGIFQRFDLARDTKERSNLFDGTDEQDQSMVSELVVRHPALFEEQLKNKQTKKRFIERLIAVNDATTTKELRFLLHLAVMEKSEAVSKQLKEIFESTRKDSVRALVAETGLGINATYFSAVLSSYLKRIAGRPAEMTFIETAARLGISEFSTRQIAGRMEWWLKSKGVGALRPWLDLLSSWSPLKGSRFAPVLADVLDEMRRTDSLDRELALSALESIAALRKTPQKHKKRLSALIAPFLLNEQDPPLRRSAAEALKRVGDRAVGAPALRQLLDEEHLDSRVAQSALSALAAIEGKRAVPLILEHGQDPLLVVDVIILLESLRAPESIAFLKSVSKKRHSNYAWKKAQHAIEKIERRRNR